MYQRSSSRWTAAPPPSAACAKRSHSRAIRKRVPGWPCCTSWMTLRCLWRCLCGELSGHARRLAPVRPGCLANAKTAAAGAGIEADSTLREVTQGRVADVIVDEARSASCDLIVMGTHGRRGFSRAAMGSDAEQVVCTSPVPVLLVRQEEAKSPASLPKPARCLSRLLLSLLPPDKQARRRRSVSPAHGCRGGGPTSCARGPCRRGRTARAGNSRRRRRAATRRRRAARPAARRAGGCRWPCRPCAGCAWPRRRRAWSQRGVGGRAAVAGNHLERLPGAQLGLDAVQQVEQLRIDHADVAGVMVAQEMVQRAQRVGHILLADRIDHAQPLAACGCDPTPGCARPAGTPAPRCAASGPAAPSTAIGRSGAGTNGGQGGWAAWT